MSDVRIITDSAAELTPEEAQELSVSILPLRYAIGNTIYKQDVDISRDRLLDLIVEGNTRVKPLPPSTDDIAAMLEQVVRSGQVALFMHVADGIIPISEPINEVARGLFGRARIEIIDSLSVSYGLHRVVTAAARAAASGASLEEISQTARGMISRIYTLFYAEDFEHLEESVDIQPAQAILASILGVRPLVVLEEGKLLPLEKVTPRTTPVEKLSDFVSEFASVTEVSILVGPRSPSFKVEDLQERVLQQYPGMSIPIQPYGPLVAASVGPSAVGLYVYEGYDATW